MKIRRLELFGFKSFKDKTIVSFDQPITAIVGSNGCGKSNVVDALYWVMGDMSPKHLRGHSMTDVIFSGSRDALALDMAEVTLVLERDPAVDPELSPQFQSSHEIQITRRYYRSGDSEYFMNKTPCRLRDIQEFFMDTGVGAKAYSIIEQGAISRLVTQKPEDRRLVIEEVAGIMKFKARKAETERKLENSRINLQRIDDLVKDLQKQLSTLKRQADKAEKFRHYSQELRQLEIQMGCKEWLDRSDSKQQALLLSAELSQLRTDKEGSLQVVREQIEEFTLELAQLEETLSSKRQNTRQTELALKDIDTRIATLETRFEAQKHRLESDAASLQQLEVRKVELEALLQEMDTELQALQVQSSQLSSQVETATEELQSLKVRAEDVREQVETTRRQLHAEELEQTRLTQQIQSFQRSIVQLQQREESLKIQTQEISSEVLLHQEERQSTLNHLEAAFSTRSDLEAEKQAVDQRLGELEIQRTELQNERDQIREELTVTRIRKEQLEALDRDLDGMDATGKVLAQHLRSLGHEDSLLADVVKVPALLEKAVEAVLGKNLQRVVAHSLNDVQDLREVLKSSDNEQAQQGRASLWIPEFSHTPSADLNALYMAAGHEDSQTPAEQPGPDGMILYREIPKVPTVREYLVTHPGVVGPLDELVRAPEEASPLWSGLLTGYWVVRDLDTLRELTQLSQQLPLGFVTLEGDVLSEEGYLDLSPQNTAAGAETVGLIQRKREISELKTQESQLESTLLLAQDRVDGCLHAVSQEKDKFRELTARLSALNPDVERHTTLLRQVEAQVARLSEKQTLLEGERERASQEAEEISLKISDLTEALSAAENRKAETQGALDQALSELQSYLNLQREAESKTRELAQEARRVDHALSELQSKRAASEQEKTLSLARRQHLESGIAQIQEELEQLNVQAETHRAERETQVGLFEVATQEERQIAEKVEFQKGKVQEHQKQAESLAAEFQSVLDRLRDIEQNLAVNDVEIRNLRDRLQEQHQVSLEELSEEQLRELASPADLEILADAEAAKTQIQALRQKIENLGKINMVAVEEFEEVSKRHEYLFIQRQDLADAISQLVDAIDRIDRESRHRFAEAFGAVNEAFKTTFPVLFGGGQAELLLTNPDNLLESGVEIVAQPPGKKLQSVTLLSGGEKALTAVSLIFGIFSIKPSPFCVLDEVDAPLDDSNVARFNHQVRNMAKTSQIIMITHHKKTMESCDALFGVTMEQPGISKVASAQLGDLKIS